jgi:uncharacterized membrane protein
MSSAYHDENKVFWMCYIIGSIFIGMGAIVIVAGVFSAYVQLSTHAKTTAIWFAIVFVCAGGGFVLMGLIMFPLRCIMRRRQIYQENQIFW